MWFFYRIKFQLISRGKEIGYVKWQPQNDTQNVSDRQYGTTTLGFVVPSWEWQQVTSDPALPLGPDSGRWSPGKLETGGSKWSHYTKIYDFYH